MLTLYLSVFSVPAVYNGQTTYEFIVSEQKRLREKKNRKILKTTQKQIAAVPHPPSEAALVPPDLDPEPEELTGLERLESSFQSPSPAAVRPMEEVAEGAEGPAGVVLSLAGSEDRGESI